MVVEQNTYMIQYMEAKRSLNEKFNLARDCAPVKNRAMKVEVASRICVVEDTQCKCLFLIVSLNSCPGVGY
jgi:hypothetical protein